MSALKRLLESLQDDATIQRFKELEKIIDQDSDLQQQYKQLLNAQKRMVQREVKQHPKYKEAKDEYETLKEKIMQHVLMSEYLDLLEQINDDLNWIQETMESEIAKDFD